jgi:DNA-binding LacI/PurR family transcriptional regulator
LGCCVRVSAGRDRGWFERLCGDLRGSTACVVYRSDDTFRLMHTAAAAGLDVPHELSVLTFSPSEPFYAGLTAVSHYGVPMQRVGDHAVERLVSMLSDRDDQNPSTELIPLSWHEGETVAPAPHAAGP